MKSQPLVCVVILNWNKNDVTLGCIRTLMESTYKNFKVIVVDNGPVEKLETRLLEEFPETAYIYNQKNLGFTGGCNQGMQFAMEYGADYVWLLNNDVKVRNETLSKLVEFIENDPSIGMVSPILLDIKQPLSSYYGSYIDRKSFKLYDSESVEFFFSRYSEGYKDVCLWGTALLIRVTAIEHVGLLDELFFAYYEDTDYSLRIINDGWRSSICGDAIVEHCNQKDEFPSYFYYYMTRNLLLLLKKHCEPELKRQNYRTWFSHYLRLAADKLSMNQTDESVAILDGIWNAITGQFGTYEGKKRIPEIIRKLLMWHPYALGRLVLPG